VLAALALVVFGAIECPPSMTTMCPANSIKKSGIKIKKNNYKRHRHFFFFFLGVAK